MNDESPSVNPPSLRAVLRTSLLALALLLAACGADDAAPEEPSQDYPDVIAATAQLDGDGTWTFAATISSPYDTPERYADAWRVLGPDGTVFGVRELAHDHANEQPFTRSLSGVEIPAGVSVVEIQGRDLRNGWAPQRLEFELP